VKRHLKFNSTDKIHHRELSTNKGSRIGLFDKLKQPDFLLSLCQEEVFLLRPFLYGFFLAVVNHVLAVGLNAVIILT